MNPRGQLVVEKGPNLKCKLTVHVHLTPDLERLLDISFWTLGAMVNYEIACCRIVRGFLESRLPQFIHSSVPLFRDSLDKVTFRCSGPSSNLTVKTTPCEFMQIYAAQTVLAVVQCTESLPEDCDRTWDQCIVSMLCSGLSQDLDPPY